MRLFRSLLTGVIVLIVVVVGFIKIRNAEKDEGTSSVLRRSFLANEELSKILFSPKNKSVDKAKPPAGKEPRVNGMLGLEAPLYPEYYSVEINSSEKNLRLRMVDFKLLPKKEFSTDFRCIEGWSEVIHYSGPSFAEFMKFYDLGKKPDGKYYAYVGLETPDRRYYVSIDMESMLHEQTLLAYEMNGKPLSVENGSPLRLIIPIKYGIKSLKRIGRIYFSDTRPPDYWAERGYDWYSGL